MGLTPKITLICGLVRSTVLQVNTSRLGTEYLCKINLFGCCLATATRKLCLSCEQKRIAFAFCYAISH